VTGDLLRHEATHAQQFRAYSEYCFLACYVASIAVSFVFHSFDSEDSYFGHPSECQAFAFESTAALERISKLYVKPLPLSIYYCYDMHNDVQCAYRERWLLVEE